MVHISGGCQSFQCRQVHYGLTVAFQGAFVLHPRAVTVSQTFRVKLAHRMVFQCRLSLNANYMNIV